MSDAVLLAIAGSEDNVFSVDEFEDLVGGFHHEVFSSHVRTAHIKLRHHRPNFQVLNEINNSQNDRPMDHTFLGRDESHVVRFVESSVRKKTPPPQHVFN